MLWLPRESELLPSDGLSPKLTQTHRSGDYRECGWVCPDLHPWRPLSVPPNPWKNRSSFLRLMCDARVLPSPDTAISQRGGIAPTQEKWQGFCGPTPSLQELAEPTGLPGLRVSLSSTASSCIFVGMWIARGLSGHTPLTLPPSPHTMLSPQLYCPCL